ncbi:MAG: hypothetical protein LW854_17020 [Rubrivivax sp.]|nr:hypothetical protein [Rubrivivax sp.]
MWLLLVAAAGVGAQTSPGRWSSGGPSVQRPTGVVPPVAVLAGRCADGGEPVPRLSRMTPQDRGQRRVQAVSDQAAAYWGGGPGAVVLAAPSVHLAPGDTIELTGGCFGEEPGSVELVFPPRSAASPVQQQTINLRPERAELQEWTDTRVRVRVPPGLSGRPPGRMELRLTHANGRQSAGLPVDFWPQWESVSVLAWVRMAACHSAADQPGACRVGDQQVAPVAGFPVPALGSGQLAARHGCRGPQVCNVARATAAMDRYTLELPPWVFPVVERVSHDHRYRRSAHSREAPPTLRLTPAVQQAAPEAARAWHLDVEWTLAEPGDELAYRIELVGLRPRGLGVPGRPEWSGPGKPQPAISAVKNPFLSQQP